MKRWLIVVLTLAATAPVAAHPTAASFVVIGVRQTTVEVAITTEERTLALKLEASSKPIDALVALRIDGRPVPLEHGRTEPVIGRPGHVRVTFEAPLLAESRTLQWEASLFFGSYPLAVRAGAATIAPEDDPIYEWIAGSASSRVYEISTLADPGRKSSDFLGLVVVGFRHILPGGLDHVLFVVGLTLLSASLRSLALQITAFTIAHSATLALAMTGLVRVPDRIVEPLIALSIAYVAFENLRGRAVSRTRLALVFVFGLLHGLGFAGALTETGLAGGAMATVLLGFNLGVELGQLVVVLAAASILRLVPLTEPARARWLLDPVSYAIAATGLFWAIQRTIS